MNVLSLGLALLASASSYAVGCYAHTRSLHVARHATCDVVPVRTIGAFVDVCAASNVWPSHAATFGVYRTASREEAAACSDLLQECMLVQVLQKCFPTPAGNPHLMHMPHDAQ
jgi:hypothetical protein